MEGYFDIFRFFRKISKDNGKYHHTTFEIECQKKIIEKSFPEQVFDSFKGLQLCTKGTQNYKNNRKNLLNKCQHTRAPCSKH